MTNKRPPHRRGAVPKVYTTPPARASLPIFSMIRNESADLNGMVKELIRKELRRRREACFVLQRRYYDSRGWVHAYRIYEREALARLPASGAVLDIGCGRDFESAGALLSRTGDVHGIDPEAAVDAWQGRAKLHRASGEAIPFDDGRFDLVIARSVLEHLDRPDRVFAEIARVLRVGGTFVFLTPSRFDYVSIIASVVPNSWHPGIVRFAEGRREQDTFPTRYRANTRAAVSRHATVSGLRVETIRFLHHCPTSLMFSPAMYRLAAIYDKTVCSHERLAFLRGWMLGVLRKV